jgi:acyl dehydratase
VTGLDPIRGASGVLPDAPSADLDRLVRVGERFGTTVRWTSVDIARFAESVGDMNPMHHDAAFAAGTRIGGIIASGTQTTAAMMAQFANWFTRRDDGVERAALGMSFGFTLRAPVFADDPVRIDWEVASREYKPKRGGWVVVARGNASTPTGVVVEAEGTGLVVPSL